MNGIQKIIERIESDADAERAQIISEAEARCAEIEASSAEMARSEYERIVSDGEQMARQRLERRTSVAALEAKKQVLAVKQEMVQAAFERAVRLLLELPDEQYVELLSRLASVASRTGNEILAFSERDTVRVGETVKDAANTLLRREGKAADLQVSPDPRNIRGGVIISCGSIETNCSLDALVSRERNALSGKVADLLFS